MDNQQKQKEPQNTPKEPEKIQNVKNIQENPQKNQEPVFVVKKDSNSNLITNTSIGKSKDEVDTEKESQKKPTDLEFSIEPNSKIQSKEQIGEVEGLQISQNEINDKKENSVNKPKINIKESFVNIKESTKTQTKNLNSDEPGQQEQETEIRNVKKSEKGSFMILESTNKNPNQQGSQEDLIKPENETIIKSEKEPKTNQNLVENPEKEEGSLKDKILNASITTVTAVLTIGVIGSVMIYRIFKRN